MLCLGGRARELSSGRGHYLVVRLRHNAWTWVTRGAAEVSERWPQSLGKLQVQSGFAPEAYRGQPHRMFGAKSP